MQAVAKCLPIITQSLDSQIRTHAQPIVTISSGKNSQITCMLKREVYRENKASSMQIRDVAKLMKQ